MREATGTVTEEASETSERDERTTAAATTMVPHTAGCGLGGAGAHDLLCTGAAEGRARRDVWVRSGNPHNMTSRSASVGSVPPARPSADINKSDLLFADNAKTTTRQVSLPLISTSYQLTCVRRTATHSTQHKTDSLQWRKLIYQSVATGKDAGYSL